MLLYSGKSRPSDKGGGGGHPDSKIRGERSKKKIFRPSGPQFGLKNKGGENPGPPGLSPGSTTAIIRNL